MPTQLPASTISASTRSGGMARASSATRALTLAMWCSLQHTSKAWPLVKVGDAMSQWTGYDDPVIWTVLVLCLAYLGFGRQRSAGRRRVGVAVQAAPVQVEDPLLASVLASRPRQSGYTSQYGECIHLSPNCQFVAGRSLRV